MDEIKASEEIGSVATKKNAKPKRKIISGKRLYLIYILLMVALTAGSLTITLSSNFVGVANAFKQMDYRWFLAGVGVTLFTFILDACVIWIFMRLYTRKYHIHQGLAVSIVGRFYSDITPGESGGQVTQTVTLKNQGTQISNAASIIVMYSILFRFAVTIFDLITVLFKFNLMNQIGVVPVSLWNVHFSVPLYPLTIIGFIINLLIIIGLFTMSYSHRMHNFVMHYGIGLLSRLHIIKEPDKKRDSIRVQVENFKIELRRLLSNIRVTILILLLFFLILICKYSIPWFMGMALNGYGEGATGGVSFNAFMDACFLSNYHRMIVGLIPIPGGAGISEVFFTKFFENYYASIDIASAAQILWRTATFYIVILVTGLVTLLYKSSPKEEAVEINRKTFVAMQLETYEERKTSSDTLYETTQISRKELQARLKKVLLPKINKAHNEEIKKNYKLDDTDINESSPFKVNDELLSITKVEDKKRKYHKQEDIEWRDFNIK